MNKEEISQWIKEAEYIVTSFFEYDECGNKEETRIYEKDGQLYSLDFCDDSVNPKWDDKCGNMSERDKDGKRIKDKNGEYIYIYEPRKVRKETKIVTQEVTEYVEM